MGGRVTRRKQTTERLRSLEAAPSVERQTIPKIWGTQEGEEEDPEKREDSEGVEGR